MQRLSLQSVGMGQYESFLLPLFITGSGGRGVCVCVCIGRCGGQEDNLWELALSSIFLGKFQSIGGKFALTHWAIFWVQYETFLISFSNGWKIWRH